MSAESGLRTFREMGGLWEEYDVQEVASPEAWQRNPELVLRFYNERRRQLESVLPNAGHLELARLEGEMEVSIITQNVDDLHERAGSSQVMHLHGELTKVRSTVRESLVYDWGYRDLNLGDTGEDGSQLRPHIVWFGEPVPMIYKAARIVEKADVLLIVGTSMQVYPAAGLLHYASYETPVYVVDPNETLREGPGCTLIRKGASEGLKEFSALIRG